MVSQVNSATETMSEIHIAVDVVASISWTSVQEASVLALVACVMFSLTLVAVTDSMTVDNQ